MQSALNYLEPKIIQLPSLRAYLNRYEMFDQRENPELLQHSLEQLVNRWFGYRKPWYGIDESKLNQVELPQPLTWLYSYAGYWPSDNWHEHLFGNQDFIYPFEALLKNNGKLIFSSENQGGWTAATLPDGDDPPVWISTGENLEEWNLVCDSLMQFLVTFCLRETIYGSYQTGRGVDLINKFRQNGSRVTPLWLDGPFAGFDEPKRDFNFYLIDNCILSMDNRCGWAGGTFVSDAVPEYDFVEWGEPPSETKSSYSRFEPIPKNVSPPLPKPFQLNHYRNLISMHSTQSDYHKVMIKKYQKILESLQNDD